MFTAEIHVGGELEGAVERQHARLVGGGAVQLVGGFNPGVRDRSGLGRFGGRRPGAVNAYTLLLA